MTVTSPTTADTERLPPRPAHRGDFKIAILCSLPFEFGAVVALLDHDWDIAGLSYGKAAGDPNLYYVYGVFGRHNVVLAFLGGTGKTSTVAATAGFLTSFPNVKLALIVGVCGAVPFDPDETGDRGEIVLGDVIVSDGIVQYDFGRRLPEEFTHVPKQPNAEVRELLDNLRGFGGAKALENKMVGYLDWLRLEESKEAAYPGSAQDRLFEATYRHLTAGVSCEECGCDGEQVPRVRFERVGTRPAVHFGLIGLGDMALESGKTRDNFAQKSGVIGFEWGSIGAWDTITCVAIKGVCDYADGHRNKVWQRYAASTAAACAKAFLDYWTTELDIYIIVERGNQVPA